MTDALARFTEPTRRWFGATFGSPTTAQTGAWDAITRGEHTLVVAPTGSGKTLAAFLWSLDRLISEPEPEDPARRCRVLYISPMKALAVDVERNLAEPLAGIAAAARDLGLPTPRLEVSVRSGDTPADARRSFARKGTDILITTPESLYLLLTSQAREMLRGIQHVIVDEIHALAGSKRGAHLALSLERLDSLLPAPAQRIGLSATVRPAEEVQRFLAGGRTVTLVRPESTKEWDLRITVPVEDMGDLSAAGDRAGGGARERSSIWPHVEEQIADLIAAHRSTIVFANSRRVAERLTARLNEIWEERLASGTAATTTEREPRRRQSAVRETTQASHNMGRAAPAILARAHHGSVSREQRLEIEEGLKSGRLPAVVATSSLELGIDMGAVDLVVQVGSPPSVASGLQRVGRAGHQVGAVSRGIFFPNHRGELAPTAVVVERMRSGEIESLRVPANPLDVLAQQVVAMCAMDEWDVGELGELVRRAAPFATLGEAVLHAVLDMLSGRYPSDEFSELRPRIVWDRGSGALRGRPGAQRLAVTSGGTIPDRGLYGVFVAGEGPGRRVGELDEEMVYESRVGDVFLLGTSVWRIEQITHDQVLVTPAGGEPGRLPFWHADILGRPAELGAAVGAFLRMLGSGSADDGGPGSVVGEGELDSRAEENLRRYVAEQREAAGAVPDDRTVVVERFRDELGDWQVAVHSVFGARVNTAWALVMAGRLREEIGVDPQTMATDDGILLRLPNTDLDDSHLEALLARSVWIEPEMVRDAVTAELGGSALFAARFRECAARALLLPRGNPGQRQALWQQRLRSSQLLQVASRYPDFPIVLEAVREVLQDVFDVPALEGLMGAIGARRMTVAHALTPAPSPFARTLLFGYIGQFMYDGDQPLAERRALALALDPALLEELLGTGAVTLAELLDPDVVAEVDAELQGLGSGARRARNAEDVADLLRRLGPISAGDVAARSADPEAVDGWLAGLERERRAFSIVVGGESRWIAVEDAGLVRGSLGSQVPGWVDAAFLEPVPEAVAVLLRRFTRTRGPFTAGEAARWVGLEESVVSVVLEELARGGVLTHGRIRAGGGPEGEWVDAQVLSRLRRRSLAAQRAEADPVPGAAYARFLGEWQGLASEPGVEGGARGGPEAVRASAGMEGLLRVVEQLAGARIPASALEALVLPARLPGYEPALLDSALAAGSVVWQGAGTIPGNDGWVALHPADSARLTLRPPEEVAGALHEAILGHLRHGGGWAFRPLADAIAAAWDSDAEGAPPPLDAALTEALWDLVWAGAVTNDSYLPLRALLSAGRSAHRRSPGGRMRGRVGGRPRLGSLALGSGVAAGSGLPTRAGPPTAAGRWSAAPEVETDPTIRAVATAEVLLDRHGVVTRGVVGVEGVEGGFSAIYRVLSRAEEGGSVRRGYFVEGLGASQFATTGAVDRLREQVGGGASAQGSGAAAGPGGRAEALVLAATDPAHPYGAALPWPPSEAGRPARSAGGLVVLVGGDVVVHLERGGRSAVTFTQDPAALAAAAGALAATVRRGRVDRIVIERADGAALLGSQHPVVEHLVAAGFVPSPRGYRISGAVRV
ncbi:MAG: ATP-dependent helicase [bacterium]|nr:ATP-dependent helicase [bacterium]